MSIVRLPKAAMGCPCRRHRAATGCLQRRFGCDCPETQETRGEEIGSTASICGTGTCGRRDGRTVSDYPSPVGWRARGARCCWERIRRIPDSHVRFTSNKCRDIAPAYLYRWSVVWYGQQGVNWTPSTPRCNICRSVLGDGVCLVFPDYLAVA